jgi:hypothetical protein
VQPFAERAPRPAARGVGLDFSLEVIVAGERRHLTALFCDLVGSTEIA